MCGGCEAAVLFGEAAEAAEEILSKIYRVDVIKVLDPLNDKDFQVIVSTLARKLATKTNPPERAVVSAAIKALDVDWQRLTRAQLDRVVDASNKVLGGLVPARLTGMPLIETAGPKIVKNTRLSTKKKYKLAIPDMTQRDVAVAQSVAGMQANFITSATGELVESLGMAVRADAAAMVEAGLSSDAIASALGAKVTAQTLGKAGNYWRVVSMAFANRARTHEQLVSYQDAKIGAYVWESVMDARTTEICRFMDGKRFVVNNALKKYGQAEQRVKTDGARGVKDTQPWVTMTRNEETGKKEMVVRTSKGEERIATVEEPGFGEDDRVGTYSNEAPLERLEAMGVSTPPVHGLCRSTIVADV